MLMELDPTVPKDVMEEYLRRNYLHCSAVGASATTRMALKRVRGWKKPPQWLVEALKAIAERCDRVHPEVARHRDEIVVYRPRSGEG